MATLVEIGTSHQIRWNILREHNWGVPSAHIMFIYYVTYVIHYFIMLWGCVRGTPNFPNNSQWLSQLSSKPCDFMWHLVILCNHLHKSHTESHYWWTTQYMSHIIYFDYNIPHCGRVGVSTHRPSPFGTVQSRWWSLIQTSSTGYIFNFLLLSLIFTMTDNFITFCCQVGPIH